MTFGSCCSRNSSGFSTGPLTVVGVEDSFLAFEDVQRRAAEPAAFQGGEKSLGVEQVSRAPC